MAHDHRSERRPAGTTTQQPAPKDEQLSAGLFAMPPGYWNHYGIQLKRDPAVSLASLGMPPGYWAHYGMQSPAGGGMTGAVVQRRGESATDADPGLAHEAARRGLQGPAQQLPHFEAIQRSFGHHDVSSVQAHVGGPAAEASRAMGAEAYATGSSVAFRDAPSLHTAAHEAAHVVQQRGGVHLKDGIGSAGDAHEQHADAVADLVVAGKYAGGLLDRYAGAASRADAVQGKVVQREEPKNQGDSARSVGDHAARTALHEAALREMYHQGERAIAAEAEILLKAGKSEAEVARWASEARTALRRAIRDQGEPIVDAIAKATRGARDMPGYEQLRAAGKTDAEIIKSAARSNAGVDRWAGRLRIAGRIMIAIDIGIAVYHVASAPEVDRPKVLAHEVGRVGGALAGGWAGAKGGAALGGAIGSLFPGAGTAIGAGIGGVVGGIGGAIFGGWAGGKAGDWVIEQFYPPAETRFEQNH